MEYCIKNDPEQGRIYWMTDGKTEVGVALDYGIRIVHLSCAGMENLYYAQPKDLSDGFGTPDTWKLRGGHRMWLAPEGEHDYHPDDEPVSYRTLPDGVLVEQREDPLLKMVKSLKITFTETGALRLDHSFCYTADGSVTGSSWGIHTLDGYGTASVSFPGQWGYTPNRHISLWGTTDLHDSRLRFTADSITASHAPSKDYFKVGIYCRDGKVEFRNKGQKLTLTFDTPPMDTLPDGGCNFELFMGERFMELEVLGMNTTMGRGDTACHTEWLTLTKL